MARVRVTRYLPDSPIAEPNEEIGEYDDIATIMTVESEASEGIAWIGIRSDGSLDLVVQEGYSVKQDGKYLEVRPEE